MARIARAQIVINPTPTSGLICARVSTDKQADKVLSVLAQFRAMPGTRVIAALDTSRRIHLAGACARTGYDQSFDNF
jgi:hypothetical protein